VSAQRYNEAVRVREGLQEAFAAMGSLSRPANYWRKTLEASFISPMKGAIT